MATTFALALIGIFFLIITIRNITSGIKAYKERKKEKKIWNQGICPFCEKGNWIFDPNFISLGHKANNFPPDFFEPLASIGYCCEGCGKIIQMRYIPFPKNTQKFDIKKLRREKLDKIKNADV